MTRPDPLVRQIIQVFPPVEPRRDPNAWLTIATTITFALGLAVAVQL